MTEAEYFDKIPFKKKFAYLPKKERTNVFNEGRLFWREWYYEYVVNGRKYVERCDNFKSLIENGTKIEKAS